MFTAKSFLVAIDTKLAFRKKSVNKIVGRVVLIISTKQNLREDKALFSVSSMYLAKAVIRHGTYMFTMNDI